MKICIVSSCGGHLTEVRQLAETYAGFDHFYVLNDTVELPDDMRGRTYFIRHSERDWLLLFNLAEAARILARERPDVILSTGAGPVVPVGRRPASTTRQLAAALTLPKGALQFVTSGRSAVTSFGHGLRSGCVAAMPPPAALSFTGTPDARRAYPS